MGTGPISIRALAGLAALAWALPFAGAASAQEALSRGEIALIVETLEQARDHGLEVAELAEIRRALRSRNSLELWLGQAALEARLAAYASVQHGGRFDSERMPNEWAIRPPPYDAFADFAQTRRDGRLSSWLAGVAPPLPAYAALLERRRAYAALAADGGWPVLDSGPALRVNDAGPRVLALRARLAREGFTAAPEAAPETFDAALAAALAAYQAARGVAPDGVLGADTIAALNVPTEAVLRQIDLNLERLRWLPRDVPAWRIEVNVPSAELVYYEKGAEALRMRAIAGARTNRTPMLAANVEAVILNPAWLVPDSIARNEILPAAAADPTYLERNGYTVTAGRVQQSPGPQNALGRVKFDAPNDFGVYMHDTPARELFARTDRALSHGCVRLERPRELAEALLRSQGLMRADIDALIDAGATTRIALPAPVPVFFLYQTAQVEAGRLRLSPDPYGWDDILARALEAVPSQSAGRTQTAAAMCAALPERTPVRQSSSEGRSR